jgi:prepilin-type N-terminal cleavage/methylation domain-containing protein
MRLIVANGRKYNQKGFTLLESLVALVILSIALLATATMLFSGLAASTSSNNRYIAGSVAQARVGELMKRPFDCISSHKTPVQDVENGMNFFTNWSTASVNATLRSFAVNTKWADKTGSHTVTISGVRAP